MKFIKFIFSVFLIAILCPKIFAKNFLPNYSYNIKYPGVGVCLIKHNKDVYIEPDIYSHKVYKINANMDPESILAITPDANIIFAAEDTDRKWVQIITEQNKGTKGWIPLANNERFLPWHKFIQKYGNKYGLYTFNDIPDQYKKIYLSPDESAQFHKLDYYNPKMIKPKIVRGNWVMVSVMNIDRKIYIGWIRWRSSEGKLYAFPNFLSGN